MTDRATGGPSLNVAPKATVGDGPARPSPLGEATPVPPTLEEVFRAHASFVARVLRRLDVPETDVDDALQEVFLTVAAKLHAYEERGTMRAWLFTIARQVASHARRAHGRRLVREEHGGKLLQKAQAMSPEDGARSQQAVRLIRQFLESLPEAQAMTFYLSDIEELTAPEIAACDGTKLNTVYARIRLARKRFEAFVRALDETGAPP